MRAIEEASRPKLYVLLMRQDDPRKCTAAKLARFKQAKPLFRVRQIPRKSIVLNPFAAQTLLPRDRDLVEAHGLVAVDCSWEKAEDALAIRLPGAGRRLPTLLAANPVNYGKAHKLSSVEALAAALYITGFMERAGDLLSLFKWGGVFLTMNREPLESYTRVKTSEDMAEVEAQFF